MDSVLLVGKPNCGKSLLFNRLTGLRQRVANYPGVTTEIKSGLNENYEVHDYPGIYSLNAITKDESVAVEKFKAAIQNSNLKVVVIVLDPLRLERSLSVGLKVQKEAEIANKQVVFVANMMDEVNYHSLKLDLVGLQKQLGAELVGISARTGEGLEELNQVLLKHIRAPKTEAKKSDVKETDFLTEARQLSEAYGPQSTSVIRLQNIWDKWVLSTTLGPVLFLAIMVVLFQSIFTWSAPLMDFVEASIQWGGNFATAHLPQGVVSDFVNDALFGGFGSFLVFVPQIFVLTFIIGLLEDSGYLARAAIICHGPLSFFGLSGKSFIPMLSGYACAIPAMMVARNIESPKKRILTLLAIPLMACSARLPVYSLLIAALIPPTTFLGGLIGYQGLSFFALYFFGLFVALLVTGLLSKTLYKSTANSPFVLELPPYRLPHWRPLLVRSINSSWKFVSKAGVIIFVVTVVVWFLGYFPNGSENLQSSYLAQMGQWIEPVFKPMGLDWKYGVAILASFLAREVFVGTLGTLFGIEGADDNIASFSESLQNSGFDLASGVSLLVFYAIALQCVSTLAVLRGETGSSRIPIYLFLFYGVLAYTLAVFTHFAIAHF